MLMSEDTFVSDPNLGRPLKRLELEKDSRPSYLSPRMLAQIIQYVDEMQDETQNAWEDACRHYAAIKGSYSIPR
jgi:hypothetical protein